MKKSMRKIVSLLLAMVMILAVSVPAFAAETKTLTINTAAGHTYEIYQVLTGDVSALTNGSGTLANALPGANLKSSAEATTDEAKVAEFDAAIKKDGAYLSGTALAAAASTMITGTPSTVNGDGTAVDTNLVTGYYVVKDKYTDSNKECAAYMVAVVGDTTMNPKTSTPDIDKNITDTDKNAAIDNLTDEDGNVVSKKTDTAAIGDVINYESTSTVPVTEGYKYYYYVVNDTMSEGLTYNKDLAIKIGSGDTETILTKDTDYTITETDRGFELVIKDMKNISETKGLAGQPITITYSATVNENAKIGTEPNTNTIKLTYSNNPSDTYDKEKNTNNKPDDDDVVGVTPDHTTKTYVTQLTLQKTDATSKIFEAALAGATFKLTGTGLNDVIVKTNTAFEEAADGTYYKLKDGTYTETAATELTQDKYDSTTVKYKATTTTTVTSLTDDESGASLNITATVDASGKITFTGLNAGEYELEETVVPTGYNKCDNIKFTISAAQSGATSLVGGAITWSSNNEKVEQSMDGTTALGVFEANIENQKGNTLPSTGGIGTTIFYVMGTILVLGAGVVLVTRKRMAR